MTGISALVVSVLCDRRQIIEKHYKKEFVSGASNKRNVQEWLPLLGLLISSVITIIEISSK
jgi:hypothetical protein